MLLAAQQAGAGNFASAPSPRTRQVKFWRLALAPTMSGEVIEDGALPPASHGRGEMRCARVASSLDLDAVEPRTFANTDFGHAVGEIGALAQMGFDDRGGGALRRPQSRCAVATVRGAPSVVMNDAVQWRVGVAAKLQARAVGGEGRVHGDLRAPRASRAEATRTLQRSPDASAVDSRPLTKTIRVAGHRSAKGERLQQALDIRRAQRCQRPGAVGYGRLDELAAGRSSASPRMPAMAATRRTRQRLFGGVRLGRLPAFMPAPFAISA